MEMSNKKKRTLDMSSNSIRRCTKEEVDIINRDDDNEDDNIGANKRHVSASRGYGSPPSLSSPPFPEQKTEEKKKSIQIIYDSNEPKIPLLTRAQEAKKTEFGRPIEDTSKYLKYDKEKELTIFCDGSCINNGKPNAIGGIGIVMPSNILKKDLVKVGVPYMGSLMCLKNEDDSSLSVVEEGQRGIVTNQRAELTAAYMSIKLAISLPGYVEQDNVIKIYTDSGYCVNTFRDYCRNWEENRWKKNDGETPKNLDIILVVWEMMKKHRVIFEHLKAHTGKEDDKSLGNDSADKLAKKASYSQMNKR